MRDLGDRQHLPRTAHLRSGKVVETWDCVAQFLSTQLGTVPVSACFIDVDRM